MITALPFLIFSIPTVNLVAAVVSITTVAFTSASQLCSTSVELQAETPLISSSFTSCDIGLPAFGSNGSKE